MATADTSAVFARATGALGARLMRSPRLMRAPIWIYKVRAGALLGSRMLMLEHVGRRSGERRHVVLDVIDHPAPDTYIVASGFGTRAQWFRNIVANPRVRIFVGSSPPAAATARVLDQPDAMRSLDIYRSRHPRAWKRFQPVLEKTLGQSLTSGTETNMPMVELRLESRP